MESLFEQVENGRIWPLTGGVHPPARKENTSGLPIVAAPLSQTLIVPLKQHIGQAGKLCVKAGDRVLKGDALTIPTEAMALPVHAPTSGLVVEITEHPVAHPSGLSEPCLLLQPDGQEQWRERNPLPHFHQQSPESLVEKIKSAGISGLGGAGFPSYVKTASARNINYLIVNATECEPYITADESLIQRSAEQIIQGIDIVATIVNPDMILIGIEDDKPQAIKALEQATEHRNDIHIRVFEAKYPSGGEKQLIKILTGQEVPSGGLPLNIGILVHNIGTLYAIYKAVVCDEPLISRIVTITGDAIDKPQNLEVLIGTPVQALLDYCGFHPHDRQRVIMGGPMMGFTLPHTQIPVVKISNCILAPGKGELPEPEDEMECIRCSACADACPVKLLPQQMLWYAKAKDLAKAEQYNIKDCIECGACAYVCPSQIPLVQYYRVAKAEIRAEAQEKQQAERAKQRFEARKLRLERDAQEREQKQREAAQRRKEAMAKSGGANAVADALARVKAKKAQQTQGDGETIAKPSGVAAAIAKAKERKRQQALAQAEPQNPAEQNEQPPVDDKKAAVAAAVARAKARKRQKEQEQSEAVEPSVVQSAETDVVEAVETSPEEAKKAAIAAAVAKAKARKQQQEQAGSETAEPSDEAPAQNESATMEATSPEDSKKAAIAAAIAKAKARKQQKEQEQQQSETLEQADKPSTEALDEAADKQDVSPADARKAAIAAAVAKAKAKKRAREAQSDENTQDDE